LKACELKAGDLKAWYQFPSLRLNAHQLNRSDAAPVLFFGAMKLRDAPPPS
jgi:hypothetical protein